MSAGIPNARLKLQVSKNQTLNRITASFRSSAKAAIHKNRANVKVGPMTYRSQSGLGASAMTKRKDA